MNANHEKLLVATLVGLIIAAAAAFAIQPALATNARVDRAVHIEGGTVSASAPIYDLHL